MGVFEGVVFKKWYSDWKKSARRDLRGWDFEGAIENQKKKRARKKDHDRKKSMAQILKSESEIVKKFKGDWSKEKWHHEIKKL